jgi:hypothetical protein
LRRGVRSGAGQEGGEGNAQKRGHALALREESLG